MCKFARKQTASVELVKLIKAIWTYSLTAKVLLVTIIAVTFITHVVGIQQTPFFMWGMYSEKYYLQQEYSYFQIVADGHTIDPYSTMYHPARHLLFRSLRDWEQMHEQGGNDPMLNYMQQKVPAVSWENQTLFIAGLNTRNDYHFYPAWFKRYLSRVTGQEFDHIAVYRVTVARRAGTYTEIDRIKLFGI